MAHLDAAIPTIVTLALAGDLDLSRRVDIERQFNRLEKADIAVLDFSKTSFIDSTILGCLVVLRKRMMKNGGLGIVRIENASPTHRRLFSISGLSSVFEVAS